MKILFLFIFSVCHAQFTLNHDGLVREYYVFYPDTMTEACPLIINMHGFGSNALEHITFSEMNVYALQQNIAVVYPEGINNAWNVGTNWDNTEADDIGFIRVLIDSIVENYNIDIDRIYACGMSNGGYMAYELACELSDKIVAFGSVTGNFMLNENQTCDSSREIPFIHFHGTSDLTVPYTYSFDGSMIVSESIAYWQQFNNLDSVSVEYLPDLDSTDNTHVKKHTYFNPASLSEFIHYEVIAGGHQWFGSTIADLFIPWLGNNNHDINTNEELINFFMKYKLSDFRMINIVEESNPVVPGNVTLHQNYPNPFNPITTLRFELPKYGFVTLIVFDMAGREIKRLVNGERGRGLHTVTWDGTDNFGKSVSSGVYFSTARFGGITQTKIMVLVK